MIFLRKKKPWRYSTGRPKILKLVWNEAGVLVHGWLEVLEVKSLSHVCGFHFYVRNVVFVKLM
jgi:hypothetical protein